jgi:hypothetical protein
MTESNPRQLVANLICTPDGTILQSFNRHDYKEYTDKNGETYMVDGGLDYLRRSVGQSEPYTELSVYSDDPFNLQREYFSWGTYGKDGDQPLKHVQLKSMSNDHIEAILRTMVPGLHPLYQELFETELVYRKTEDIKIYD